MKKFFPLRGNLIYLCNVFKIYLDNAATTPIDALVVEEMSYVLRNYYGNPSSIHSLGREARTQIEKSRKRIAEIINCSASEIFFTSGGTEADNLAIRGSVKDLGVTHIISSEIEHHAVKHTIEDLEKRKKIRVSWLKLDDKGRIDLINLKELLNTKEKTLVSLMHANNEIGTMINLEEISNLCKETGAIFHSDTVQTFGHFPINVKTTQVDFLACSAHKFHGPKGIGFIYINSRNKINPIITGGSQERNLRAGTENLYGIVGLTKALEIAVKDMSEHANYIRSLKNYMIERLIHEIPDVKFNGETDENSLYTVLNVQFPVNPNGETFLMKLDIAGICASGGSACTSGSDTGSHVLRSIGTPQDRPNIRFSFSKYNTKEEIEKVVQILKSMI